MVRALPPSGVAVLNGDDPNVMLDGGTDAARGSSPSASARTATCARPTTVSTGRAGSASGCGRSARNPTWQVRFLGRHLVYRDAGGHRRGATRGRRARRRAGQAARSCSRRRGGCSRSRCPTASSCCATISSRALETMHAALDVLAAIPARRRIVVFGDVAEPPSSQHALYRELGRAGRGDRGAPGRRGPRTSSATARGARRGGMPRERIHDGGRTPRSAAAIVATLLQPGDVVLIKGRGTQMLDRVRLILEGRRSAATSATAASAGRTASGCPMLESGWGTHRVVMARRPEQQASSPAAAESPRSPARPAR